MWPICFNLTTQLLQLTQYILDHWLFLVLGHPVKTPACPIIDWMISNHPKWYSLDFFLVLIPLQWPILWGLWYVSSLNKKTSSPQKLEQSNRILCHHFWETRWWFSVLKQQSSKSQSICVVNQKTHFCWVNHGKSRQTTTKIKSRLLRVSFLKFPHSKGRVPGCK